MNQSSNYGYHIGPMKEGSMFFQCTSPPFTSSIHSFQCYSVNGITLRYPMPIKFEWKKDMKVGVEFTEDRKRVLIKDQNDLALVESNEALFDFSVDEECDSCKHKMKIHMYDVPYNDGVILRQIISDWKDRHLECGDKGHPKELCPHCSFEIERKDD